MPVFQLMMLFGRRRRRKRRDLVTGEEVIDEPEYGRGHFIMEGRKAHDKLLHGFLYPREVSRAIVTNLPAKVLKPSEFRRWMALVCQNLPVNPCEAKFLRHLPTKRF